MTATARGKYSAATAPLFGVSHLVGREREWRWPVIEARERAWAAWNGEARGWEGGLEG